MRLYLFGPGAVRTLELGHLNNGKKHFDLAVEVRGHVSADLTLVRVNSPWLGRLMWDMYFNGGQLFNCLFCVTLIMTKQVYKFGYIF